MTILARIIGFLEDRWPEIFIGVFIIALLAGVFYAEHEKEHVTMPAAFRAWVKQTGNEKDLSYEEWRALMRGNENQNSNEPLYHLPLLGDGPSPY